MKPVVSRSLEGLSILGSLGLKGLYCNVVLQLFIRGNLTMVLRRGFSAWVVGVSSLKIHLVFSCGLHFYSAFHIALYEIG